MEGPTRRYGYSSLCIQLAGSDRLVELMSSALDEIRDDEPKHLVSEVLKPAHIG